MSAQLLGCLRRVWKVKGTISSWQQFNSSGQCEILIRTDLTSSSEIREPVNSDHK